MTPGGAAGRRPVALCAALVALALLLAALAGWQLRRLAWKEALIARVEAGAAAPPLPATALPPGPLPALEYRRVALTGRYLARGTVLVAGASVRGSGYWVLTPLAASSGTIYVNRGFVPLGSRAQALRRTSPEGPVAVTGLLRLSEPGGGFLRANRPAEDRWYARDIAAIAAARRIRADPRFFIDAQHESPAAPGGPVPGLTRLRFANNHLAYALTWAVLAALSAGAATVLWRRRA